MLRFEKVHAGYGRVEVLRGVDLVVPPGSVVALLGANGAGKTTLLKTALGLVRVRSGRVTVDRHEISTTRTFRRARQGVCLIPEGRGVFPRLTVRENLAMFAGEAGPDAAAERAAEAFPVLGSRLGQLAGTLSGGEQQMLAMSRALISTAPLVLADELSLGLAPVIVDEIFGALEALRRQGRALLVVEQYVSRALALADYVYVLHKGEVVFVGEPGLAGEGVLDRYLGETA